MDIHERQIEEMTLNSWPAHRQLVLDGWVVRFGNGYTKRANSVTPVYTSLRPAQEKIALCEHYYQEMQLPTIFRLPSCSPDSAELDRLLAQRNYQRVDLTLVLHMPLAPDVVTIDPAVQAVSLDEWLPIFYQFQRHPVEQQQRHREILERIVPAESLFAVLQYDKQAVACGVGVLVDGIFGIFDIVTDPDERKKGYGTQLMMGMLAWARQRGARHTFLQVVATNEIACHLYAKLGYHELYRYWYRVQPR